MKYFLIDLERTLLSGVPAFWKASKFGYTYHIHEAGLFDEAKAEEIIKGDIDKRTVKISLETVEDILSVKLR